MGLGGSGWGPTPPRNPRRVAPRTPVRRPVGQDRAGSGSGGTQTATRRAAIDSFYANAPNDYMARQGPALTGWVQGYESLAGAGGAPPTGSLMGGGGGGRGGYGRGGGGGGGGGAPALTQATLDAMARVLGLMPQSQTYTDIRLPAFQGQNIGAFNAAPYNQLDAQLASAYQTDMANIAANQQAVTQAVQSNFQDPYAAAQVVGAPAAAAPVGAALAGAAGGDTGALTAAAQGGAAGEQGSQAAFQNLLNVLSANANQSQASRMNQIVMDANTGRQNVGAQRTGLAGQIGMQRAGAQQAWQQRDEERRYQNSMTAQQQARDLALTNAQGRQQVGQANVQTRNDAVTARIQPLLDLLAQTNGVGGLNINSLTQLLARLGAR